MQGTLRFAILALLLVPNLARPNDSTARIGAGGLVFTKTNDITMSTEHLVISEARVQVSYTYRNLSAHPVETVVAFPTPAYPGCLTESQLDANQRPVEGFTATIDGVLIKTTRIRSAVVGQVDVTKKLQAAGLSESQIFPPLTLQYCSTWRDAAELYTAKQRQQLKASGLLGSDWKTADTYHWKQVFPVDKDLQVTHQYTPFAGDIYTYLYPRTEREDSWEIPVSSIWDDRVDRACVDEGARQAILKRAKDILKAGAPSVLVVLRDVEYILGTARNWKGPIGNFTLDVVKSKPEDIVSLCFPGRPTKINPTTLRFQHSNFAPPDRVQVNFYSVVAGTI